MKTNPQSMPVGTGLPAEHVRNPRAEAADRTHQHEPCSPQAADEAALSTQVRELLFAREALAGVPEVREDKVAQIRQQIEDGTFEIDPEAIADKLLSGEV